MASAVVEKGVTLLWALQSPCNMGCLYCYYGTIEDDLNRTTPLMPGQLSHVGEKDLSLDSILRFASSIRRDLVKRVFIVGGEPLNWKGTFSLISELKKKGCDVVVSTNGLPLLRNGISKWLIENRVDAISVSLDSIDFDYNNRWRIDKTNRGGKDIVKGMENLVHLKRGQNSAIKIGVYCVVSKKNISHVLSTARLLDTIGVDYFVFQPISLALDHKLYKELALDETHYTEINEMITNLLAAGLKIQLPNTEYLNNFLKTLPENVFHYVNKCFGGRDLFFIQPDGSIWDCPSIYKKNSISPSEYVSITNSDADFVFSPLRRGKITDCSLLSKDCVNMWQLMSFDQILDV